MHNANTALLIDFENLVLGLEGDPEAERGEQWSVDDVPLDPALFFRLAEAEEGQVAVARAYADWRFQKFNRHQVELYRNGIELVHVLGKSYKNAVDLRLAIDAVELSYEHPHINTFIIVSGDRDFIHLIKHLRKRSRKVIGVAPRGSFSRDLASLYDRFMSYRGLWLTYAGLEVQFDEEAQVDAQRLRVFKASLSQVLDEHVGEEGLPGHRLKALIRRHISPVFDEADFGYPRLSQMLREMSDVVRVETDGQGEFWVYPERVTREVALEGDVALEGAVDKARVRLGALALDWDRRTRDAVLRALHHHMLSTSPFTFNRLVAELEEEFLLQNETLSARRLHGYLKNCYQARMFSIWAEDRRRRIAERRMALREDYSDLEDFVERFEESILSQVFNLLPQAHEGQVACAKALLELQPEDDDDYILDMIERIERGVRHR